MKRLVAAAICIVCVGWLIGCGGKQKAPTKDPAEEVQQLIKLYQEAKAKFVVQKQNIIQDEDCGRATRLRGAIDKMAEEAAMSTENTEVITKVQMELQQAEQECLAK